jgi:uroporphyrinogen decarboxylase
MGDDGVMGFGVNVPGLQSMCSYREGGVEAMTYDYYDRQELVLEWGRLWHDHVVGLVRNAVRHKPDYIMLQASGLLTLRSPALFRELSLPTIEEVTRIARENGIPSHLHACGKSRHLVEVFAKETELDSICPLETAPMGDVDLAEVKRLFGKRLCLKGNLHTTAVMLLGTPKDVERAARKCIDDAAEGGGYILATGDQCGRDTPFENLFMLSGVARTYGVYR